LFILEYAPLFIAGINFYRIKTNGGTVLNHVIIVASFLLECKWLLLHPDENYGSVAILAIIYAVFYLFTYQKLSWLNNQVLLFLGTISYSLYLLHNVIGYSIIYRVRQYTDVQALYVIAPMIFSISIATLMTFFIEKPAIKFIRNSYKKSSAKQIAYTPDPLANEVIN
jgi:peptidoglycan/LPS O-acetylase OafA/YrhL